MVNINKLSDEQKQLNKKTLLSLLAKLNIDLTSLYTYLETIDYFEKPGSIQYKFAYTGGLCEYTLKFCHELGVLCNAYFPGKYTEQDVIIISFFHVLYKAELYESYAKNVKNDDTGLWERVQAFRNKEIRPVYGDISFSSYMLAKKFISLTDEQTEAIMYGSSLSSYSVDIYEIMRQYPLVTLSKMAEMVVNYL